MKKTWILGMVLLLLFALAGCNSRDDGGQDTSDLLDFTQLVADGVTIENGEFQISQRQLVYALNQVMEDEILLAEETTSDNGDALYLYKVLDYVELHLFQNDETDAIKEIMLFVDQKLVTNPEEMRANYAAALSAILAPESQETLLSLLEISDGDSELTLGGVHYYSTTNEMGYYVVTLTPAE